MPFSKFDSVQVAGGNVFVGGPFDFGADEPSTNVPALHFVLIQDDVVVEGTGQVSGRGRWDGQAVAGNLDARDALGFGMAVLIRRPGDGTHPSVETFNWTEAVTVTE
jgi:hypothetical protein